MPADVVLLTGDVKLAKLTNALLYGTTRCDETINISPTPSMCKSHPPISVLHLQEPPAETINSRLLLALDAPISSRPLLLADGVLPIVDSSSDTALRLLCDSGNPTVTCGFSSSDSVTVSSISPDRAMLTVQRELPTIPGGVIEPCELAMRFSGCDIGLALPVACIYILLYGLS